jgi:anti-anti-sigma factor
MMTSADRLPLRRAVPGFAVRVDQRGRIRVVEVEGEVDLLTAPTLMAAVTRDNGFDSVVFDLGKVAFISARGLALIASLDRTLSRRLGGVALVGVGPLVARLLEIMGLDEALPAVADVPSALALLGGMQYGSASA